MLFLLRSSSSYIHIDQLLHTSDKLKKSLTFVKYEEVQITGDADLILGGTADFVINVYNLTV